MNQRTWNALERVGKWRRLFAGWQLGTRPETDGEFRAVADHREVTILLRIESNALTSILLRKGVITREEWTDALGEEADALNAAYAKRFPGITATPNGMQYDLPAAAETMRANHFPP